MLCYLRVLTYASCVFGFSVYGQVDFTSSNLPILVIDTHGQAIPDDPKITADLGIIDNGPGQRNNMSDAFHGYVGKIGIELRGSTSQDFPKKPYGLELRDDAGEGVSASLLGMPAEEDWALIATYNDKSLLRDALAYKLGRDLGRYAARTRFCELVMQRDVVIEGVPAKENVYMGIYMLTEKIKRDKNRVDISKLDPEEISGDDLTGGYILKIDKYTGDSGSGFPSQIAPPNRSGNQSVSFQYEYPEYDEIVSEQRQYIQTFIRNFESTLNGSTYQDETNGYAKYIDVNSFADFLIINELSKNVDGYRLSTFMYKDKDSKGGKMVMGPVWDFNLAFGNADYCQGAPVSGWMYNFNSVCSDDGFLIPFWWKRLLTDSNFRERLALRWAELRAGVFSTSSIHRYIDSVANVLDDEAAGRNFTKWPVLGVKIWPNFYVGDTYQQEVDWLKDWVLQRTAWLDANMPSVVTAIGDEAREKSFSLSAYPNPFTSELKLEYTVRNPCQVTLELFNSLGQRVARIEQDHVTPGTHLAVFNPAGMGDGVYYFKVGTSQDRSTVIRRVIKRHD
jgi:hypothetical protein